ncbi:CBN-CLC-3 protein [Aphelenchoides avenae]|nr:CBN-CLC-3 protein [Aphelenchus avenae]
MRYRYRVSQVIAYALLLVGTILLFVAMSSDNWSTHYTVDAYILKSMYRGLLRQCLVMPEDTQCRQRLLTAHYQSHRSLMKILGGDDVDEPFFEDRELQLFELGILILVVVSVSTALLLLACAPCTCFSAIFSVVVGLFAGISGLLSASAVFWYMTETLAGNMYTVDFMIGSESVNHENVNRLSWAWVVALCGCVSQLSASFTFLCVGPGLECANGLHHDTTGEMPSFRVGEGGVYENEIYAISSSRNGTIHMNNLAPHLPRSAPPPAPSSRVSSGHFHRK